MLVIRLNLFRAPTSELPAITATCSGNAHQASSQGHTALVALCHREGVFGLTARRGHGVLETASTLLPATESRMRPLAELSVPVRRPARLWLSTAVCTL